MANNTRPIDRARAFSALTRKHRHMMPPKAGADNSRISFDIPKVRLGSRIFCELSLTLTATHASKTAYTAGTFSPWTYINNVTVDLNNGWAPVQLTGTGLYLWNLINAANPAMLANSTTDIRRPVYQPLVSSSGGTANTVKLLFEIPLMLNERDPIGLIMLQNQETLVNLTIDLGDESDLAPAAAGYTFATSSIVLTPMVETFSIPLDKNYYPDLSILKLCNMKTQTIPGAGQVNLDLPCGNMYRKLLFFIQDATGGEADADISGNLELIFNQSDVVMSQKPSLLAAINAKEYGVTLPAGVYAFDFSNQGIPNLGTARDYIDTERLTDFQFRFTAAGAGSITAVYETLARLMDR